jgi:cytoskeletal protein RodZ
MFIRGIYASHTLRLSQFSARAMSNPLKRPAPATRDSSSSSIQIISPQKPKPKADVSLDDESKDSSKPTDASVPSPTIPSASTAQVKKVEDKAVEPPTKKPKIALVPGGAGSGGQTKLAFGKVGGGKASSTLGPGAGVGKKAVAGTGSSSGGSGGEC